MPLLNMVGSTGMNTTFQIAVSFQRGETEDDYMFSLENLSKLLSPGHKPKVFVIDRELSLYNALKKMFSRSSIILCRWHVNKNILTNCRSSFPSDNDNANGGSAHWVSSTWLATIYCRPLLLMPTMSNLCCLPRSSLPNLSTTFFTTGC